MRPRRAWRPRGPPGCPECGGLLLYERDTKTYVCQDCGRMFTREELAEARRRIKEELRRAFEEDEEEQRAREYLKWYLSSHKE